MAGLRPQQILIRGRDWARHAVQSTPLILFGFFALLYLLGCQARTNNYDGMAMYLTTRSLVDHGTLAIDNPLDGRFGRDGLYYSKYGIGLSLVQIPFYLLGKLIALPAGDKSPQVIEFVTMLSNPLIMALSCLIFYFILRTLGYRRAISLRATLALGLATSFWPYSKTDFSEPLLTLCLLFAVLFMFCMRQPAISDRRVLTLSALAGGALGLAVLTKSLAIVFVPVFMIYEIYLSRRVLESPSWTRWLRMSVVLLAPVLAAVCVTLTVNTLRFGSPLITGYDSWDHPFNDVPWVVIPEMLIGPYRGLLFFDTLLFAGLVTLIILLFKGRHEIGLGAGIVAAAFFIYGSYGANLGWTGGPTWGPRYLVPIMPYLLFPMLAIGAFGRDKARLMVSTWLSPAVAQKGTLLLLLISVPIQVLGVITNYMVPALYYLPPSNFDDVRTSPILVAIWTVPLTLSFALTKRLPATGYASSDYPFGPPFPTNPHMPEFLGQFFPQSFWFTLFPHPPYVALVGILVLGPWIVLSARVLWRRAIPATDTDDFGSSVVMGSQTARGTIGGSRRFKLLRRL
jgi:hypothetical protein